MLYIFWIYDLKVNIQFNCLNSLQQLNLLFYNKSVLDENAFSVPRTYFHFHSSADNKVLLVLAYKRNILHNFSLESDFASGSTLFSS